MKRYIAIGPALVGALLITTTILERSPGRPAGSILLLSGGLAVAALAVWVRSLRRPPGAQTIPAVPGWLRNGRAGWLWSARFGIFAGFMLLIAVGIYAFVASIGTWSEWPETSHYYDALSAAFLAGRLDLRIQPSTELAAQPNPYEPSLRNRLPELRAFVKTVWDLSYYKGKFYAYWGPAPALLLAIIKMLYGGTIGDQYLAFAFLFGLLIFSTLLLLRVRRKFHLDVPVSLVMLGVACAAFAYPIPWMLSHAAVYEASIAAGQFFLIGGLYFAYLGLEQDVPSASSLILAAFFWTMAVASRLVTILPIAFLMGVTWLWYVEKNRARTGVRETARYLGALGLPLLAGLVALGLYNWLRFGSAFETGVRYMLTSVNLSRYYSETFMRSYTLQNLALYITSPLTTSRGFPFIWPKAMSALNLPPSASRGIHHVEGMTGLAYAVPFALFSTLPIVQVLRSASKTLSKSRLTAKGRPDSALTWLTVSLIGCSLLSLAALLMYFYVAIRFLADVVPSLLLLSVLGAWQGYSSLKDRVALRPVYALAAMALGGLSIVISLLLTMAESYPQFEAHNPQLLRQILHLFAH